MPLFDLQAYCGDLVSLHPEEKEMKFDFCSIGCLKLYYLNLIRVTSVFMPTVGSIKLDLFVS
jgi:hypothetical protein